MNRAPDLTAPTGHDDCESNERRLREIQLQYVRQLQTIVGSSARSECVGLFCTQLLDLADGPGNALAGELDDGEAALA